MQSKLTFPLRALARGRFVAPVCTFYYTNIFVIVKIILRNFS
nr:MAG TPA: hypothetical protein [Caudoviricetes sp.]